MGETERKALTSIRGFDELLEYLERELDWPIAEGHDEVFFDYSPEELGIGEDHRVGIDRIRRLRSPNPNSPWGIFFVEFAKKRLPVVALRRILSRVTMKKRMTGGADLPSWRLGDLLFISLSGAEDDREITFAHFTEAERSGVPTLKVLGWDGKDTSLRLDHVADKLEKHLRWPDDGEDVESWRHQWRAAFTATHREPIKTAGALSSRLAVLAKGIRERVGSVLEIENEKGWVTKLMKSFEEALLHGLTKPDFADMYAQTVAYGLLSARITDPDAAAESSLARYLRTNPLLREMLEAFLAGESRVAATEKAGGIDFDELAISEVVDLLDTANMEEVLLDFRRQQRNEDPVVHFYESFLRQYDPELRTRRGVFYTPREVVRYIVRSVDALLRSEFGLEDGLADTTTWGDLAQRRPGLVVPDDVSPDSPFVTVLDPATGTGTFLVEVIDCIRETLARKWATEDCSERQVQERWDDYVEEHLLSRLYGYELLMAPYAMAHLNISLKLRETGFRFGSDRRAHVYLTNTLEPPHDHTGKLDFAVPALALESTAVNATKEDMRFTVVLGNPPYSGHSSNRGPWIRDLLHGRMGDERDLEDYYSVGGEPLGEKNPKWLDDDYVKFVRHAQWTISRAACGIVGFVTNHSYLDSPTFRGMRESLMKFQKVHILDLHGNAQKKERTPEGGVDQNVFDIKQGVSISVLVRSGSAENDVPQVVYADLWGRRNSNGGGKYPWLEQETVETTAWRRLDPKGRFFFFVPRDDSLAEEYEKGWSLPAIFPLSSVGIVTARDSLTIQKTREAMESVVSDFRTQEPEEARKKYRLHKESDDWSVPRAQKALRQAGGKVVQILYRPFDVRWTWYSGSRGFICRPRFAVMRHMLCERERERERERISGWCRCGKWPRARSIMSA